ncbi:hypothetical protein [Marivirga sp.]|uniref:hypothetical protein n=1 Tax=Marivirga sp. TaxID=2018662 RepID=UPI0025CF07B6|nr:hypothetical protein [Marivirga sp.]
MKKGLLIGIILIAIGSFIIYWAIDHSPNAPIGERVTDLLEENSYRMSEAWYYTSLIAGSIIALLGLRNLLKS